MKFSKLVLVGAFLFLVAADSESDRKRLFELNVIHLNDFHARFEETTTRSGECKQGNKCIGGFARLVSLVNKLKQKPNAILLNAGDNFQGTLWYTLFKWNVTQHFMNLLPFDAYTLGNHEFDDRIKGLVPFLKALNAPVVVSNIDDSFEPDLQGLYQKSTVIERDGKKIGIIGVILSTTNQITNSERFKFLDEVESINAEAQRLIRDVPDLFTIIVLSHCGYDVEQKIAKNVGPKISLIVGGHSHSLLYNGDPPNSDIVFGPYPTVVRQDNGNTVLVVQASSYTKYLGNLTVYYDDNGEVVDYEGIPIYIDNEVPQDADTNNLLEPWKKIVDDYGSRNLGYTNVFLDNAGCFYEECNIGDFYTDAMVDAFIDKAEEGHWNYVAVAVTNAGSIRTSIPVGNITYNDLLTSQPFENTLDVGEIQGKYIKEALEHGTKVFAHRRSTTGMSLLQVSGLKMIVNMNRAAGERVSSIEIRCNACPEPVYEDLDLEKTYRLIVPSFLAGGGDGFTALSENLKNRQSGPRDIEAYENYIKKASPINQGLEERITVIDHEASKRTVRQLSEKYHQI